MTTITGGSEHTPLQILEYEARADVRNVVNDITGTNEVATTRRPASLRRGSMTALFDSLSDALALFDDLRSTEELSLEDTELSELDMTFITSPASEISIREDYNAPDAWLVRFSFLEVL